MEKYQTFPLRSWELLLHYCSARLDLLDNHGRFLVQTLQSVRSPTPYQMLQISNLARRLIVIQMDETIPIYRADRLLARGFTMDSARRISIL